MAVAEAVMGKKKRFPRFKDLRILTKLLVVMLVLSWLPVTAAMVLAVQANATAARTEMDNYILERVSDSVHEMQQPVIQFIQQNHNAIQAFSEELVVVQFLKVPPAEADAARANVINAMEAVASAGPLARNLALFNRQGVVAASLDPEFVGKDD